jgi:hypothetical protein
MGSRASITSCWKAAADHIAVPSRKEESWKQCFMSGATTAMSCNRIIHLNSRVKIKHSNTFNSITQKVWLPEHVASHVLNLALIQLCLPDAHPLCALLLIVGLCAGQTASAGCARSIKALGETFVRMDQTRIVADRLWRCSSGHAMPAWSHTAGFVPSRE